MVKLVFSCTIHNVKTYWNTSIDPYSQSLSSEMLINSAVADFGLIAAWPKAAQRTVCLSPDNVSWR